MLYIHQTACISPQLSFDLVDLGRLEPSVNNRLIAREPVYPGIPPGQLRRMGKAVRMGIGATLSLGRGEQFAGGIIIGTGNGGMEDSIQFLNQLIEYDEGMLTPGHFVQSTANAVASQISIVSRNHGYNCTHVHRGLAFENALLDALLFSKENPGTPFLLGAVDEISEHHYNIERLEGCYKEVPVSNSDLYSHKSAGTIAGEGAVMFLVSGSPDGASACVKSLAMIHASDPDRVSREMENFLSGLEFQPSDIDLFLSGENGDLRLEKFTHACLALLPDSTPAARYKHMCGEYPTASAMASWLACRILMSQDVPAHMFRRPPGHRPAYRNILLYNGYKGVQHSFILISSAP